MIEVGSYYNITPEDFDSTLVSDTTCNQIIFNLPQATDLHIGKWVILSKLGTGTVSVNVPEGYRIDSSSTGGCISCLDITVATIQLQYVKSNRWISVSKVGNWNVSW